MGTTRVRKDQAAGDEVVPGPGLAPAAEPAVPPAPIVTPPVLLTPSVSYPDGGYAVAVDRTLVTPELRILASEGRVVLRLLVRADGTAGSVTITQSSGHPRLDAAALETAHAWSFRPATRDGIAIDAWAVIPVRFVLP